MIRFAKQEDGPAIAELILIILKDMELEFLTRYGEEVTKQAISEAVKDPTYRYGYRRGLVAEIDGKVAGVAFGYPAEDEAIIDQPLKQALAKVGITEDITMFIDSEVFPNEWYLDSIAVNENYRGHGIGSTLIEALDQIVLRDGKETIGLNVDEQNPAAKRLYEREGFSVMGSIMISGHHYEHMQKKLKAN